MKRGCEQGYSERKIMLRAANVFVLESSLQMCNFKDLLKNSFTPKSDGDENFRQCRELGK